ncbi:MAG: hypothetical protein H6626_00345 [Pseudobdellovibrionaceae bacterium]|nr:MAG: hypothetical protein H6626_00345 [Pseudobdellovibrionaceae bacterium]
MLFCQNSIGGDATQYLLWQEYEMKSGEWIYQVVRRSPFVKSGLLSPKQLVAEILSKNPQLKDPNLVSPGVKLLMPIAAMPEFATSTDGRVVNYNFYIGSQIYYGNSAAKPNHQNLSPSQSESARAIPRSVANKAQQMVSEVRAKPESGGDWGFHSVMGLGFYYNFIKTKDLLSGSGASRASGLNQSIDLNVEYGFWDKFLFESRFLVGNENYSVGGLQTLDFTAGFGWKLQPNWIAGIAAGYTQVPVITTNSGALALVNIGVPKLGPNLRFLTKAPWEVGLELGISYDSLLAGRKDLVEVEGGAGYRIDITGSKTVLGYELALQTWYGSKAIKTNITEQTTTGTGMALSWSGDF